MVLEILLSSSLGALFQIFGKELYDLCKNYAEDMMQMDDNVEKLIPLMHLLGDVFANAVMEDKLRQSNENEKLWLSQAIKVLNDAENIVDEVKYESARQKEEGTSLSSLLTSMPNKIVKITSQVKNLIKDQEKLRLFNVNECRAGNPTSSLEPETAVCGRDEEAKQIMEIIEQRKSQASPVVIPIVGIAGIGKTTLARCVYNHEHLAKWPTKVWISVTGSIDVEKITKEIFDKIIVGTASASRSSMQERIKEKLTNETYIIVLDDVCNAIPDTWRGILPLFKFGRGIVIVTTRCEAVAKNVGTVKSVGLQTLSDDHCWKLFFDHSKFDQLLPRQRSVIEKMMGKCRGLPLAVATLGDIVSQKKHESRWEDALKGSLWDLANLDSNMMTDLRRRYAAMDYKLKRCFAMCALFPDKYEFDENEIVSLWLGAGLIEWEEITLYDGVLRHEYFKKLVAMSVFIQKPESPSSNEQPRYTMHELYSDMASQVMGGSLCKLDQNSPFPPKWDGVRHFSCSTTNFRDILDQWSRRKEELSIITIFVWGKERDDSSLVGEVSSKLKYVRVLSVPGLTDSEAYDWIDNLKHLRCVRVNDFLKVNNQRESFSKLYQLEIMKSQVLELPMEVTNLGEVRVPEVRKLPMGVTNLRGLRVLDVRRVEELLPEEIGNLEGLLLLSLPSSEIEKLPSSIGGLCNLQELCLEGCSNLKKLPDEIEKLRCLKMLTLSASGITELPSCIVRSLPAGLAELRLYNCPKLTLSAAIRSLDFVRH